MAKIKIIKPSITSKKRRSRFNVKKPKEESTPKIPKIKSFKLPSKRRGRPPLSEARAEAVRQLRDSLNKLRARVKRVEKRFGVTPALQEYYKRGLDKLSTKNKTLEELGKMQADIDYISGLKTTYVEGARAYDEHIAPLLEVYKVDKDTYDKIMYIYNRMVEEYGILEKFKYQVLDMVSDMAMVGATTKEIAEVVRDMYDQMYEGDMEGVSNEYGYGFSFGGKVRPKY
jgi:hypothetical protein